MGLSSAILSGIVSMSCGSIPDENSRQACAQAIEAGAKQSKLDKKVKKIESAIAESSKETAEEWLGTTGIQTVGAVAFVANIASGGRVRVGEKGPLDGHYYVEANILEARVGARWEF